MPSFHTLIPYLALFAGSFALMMAIVPLLSVLAKKIGLVDKPDERRKLHSGEIPLIGGLGIFLAILVACISVFALSATKLVDGTIAESILPSDYLQLGGLVCAAVLIIGVGYLDDRFGIRGCQKLLAQLVVAFILVGTGTWIQSLSTANGTLGFGETFTSELQKKYAKLNSELDEFQKTEIGRIHAKEAEGKLTWSEAKKEASAVVSNFEDIQKNAYLRLFVFDRMLALTSILLTVIWIVGAINSVNLIDGADGLAGTTTFIVSLALAIVAYWTQHYVEAAISLSLAGAILGFLVFNFPPAKIFLGDAGSMLIGMVLASLAVQSYLKEPMIYICMAPLAMLFIPIFDSFIAFARRIATGRSIYSSDRGHLHHILLRHGLSDRGMVLFVGGLTTITAVGAVLTVVLQDSKFSIIGVVVVVVFLVSSKVFGFAEFKLLFSRMYQLLRSFLLPKHQKSVAQSMSVQLQGSKEWGELWKSITDFAEAHSFIRIKLDLNFPWLHESFHADWTKPNAMEKEEIWQTRLPLAAKGRAYGRIEISGVVGQESIYILLNLMSDLLENLEPALAKLAEGHTDKVDVPVLRSRRRKPAKIRPSDAKKNRDRIVS